MKERKWSAVCSLVVLATMVNVARTTAQETPRPFTSDQDSSAPVRIAPPPPDPFELVTSQPITEQTPETRAAVIALLKRAFQQHAFGRRYTVKVACTAAGPVQEVGPGEMDETGTAVNHRRWTGRVGSFSMTRIITDRGYDSVPPGPVPIRLQMVRANVLGPAPPSTWGVIRTAKPR